MNKHIQHSANPEAALAPVASAITGDWPRIVDVWEEFRSKYGYFLRADVRDDPQSFLCQALWQAHGRGQLRALIGRLYEQGLASDAIHAAAAPFVGAGFEFQAYVNGEWRPQNALVAGRQLMQACDRVCRIAVRGAHRGTGVLIRPTVVATAAHVVHDLLDAAGRCKNGSLADLEITFFDADDLLPDGAIQVPKPVVAQLHPDWLAYLSPSAPGEGGALYNIDCIDGISPQIGPWDIVLIRLAAPPRVGLTGHKLRGGTPPDAAFGVHVLHHPADPQGAPMGLLWSIGEVTEALGDPPLRWLHDANTDGGSSGAPCFDSDWRVVGLHQAGTKKINDPDQANRAVPIYPWADQVDALAQAVDKTPHLTEALTEDGVLNPVFGRLDVQGNIWRAMAIGLPAEERTILVFGGPHSGKTFTGAILKALAKRAGGHVITIDARNAQADDALGFAQRLIGAAGVSLPQHEGTPSGLTTDLRDLRAEILPVLLRELETLAGEAPLWLFIDGLEASDRVLGSGVAQLVDSLIASLDQAPHLRLLLIGWNGVVNSNCQESLPPGPSNRDVALYLWRALAPAASEPSTQALGTFEILANDEIAKQPANLEPFAKALAAARALTEVVRKLIPVYVPPPNGGR